MFLGLYDFPYVFPCFPLIPLAIAISEIYTCLLILRSCSCLILWFSIVIDVKISKTDYSTRDMIVLNEESWFSERFWLFSLIFLGLSLHCLNFVGCPNFVSEMFKERAKKCEESDEKAPAMRQTCFKKPMLPKMEKNCEKLTGISLCTISYHTAELRLDSSIIKDLHNPGLTCTTKQWSVTIVPVADRWQSQRSLRHWYRHIWAWPVKVLRPSLTWITQPLLARTFPFVVPLLQQWAHLRRTRRLLRHHFWTSDMEIWEFWTPPRVNKFCGEHHTKCDYKHKGVAPGTFPRNMLVPVLIKSRNLRKT